MVGTWIVITVAIALLLGAVTVRAARSRRTARLSPMERGRRATRQLSQERRALRGRSSRGTGDHFGKTKIKKYGDERHGDAESDGGSAGDSGGGDSSSGSSW
jgi:hypothetical protein